MDTIKIMEYLQIPLWIVVGVIGLLLVLNIIGSILDFKGKVWPEIINFRRWRRRKKEDKEKQGKLLERLEARLASFEQRYSADNIARRDTWMGDVNSDREWMHQRAEVYDQSIVEITNSLHEAANQLRENTKMTEDMFVESSRDRIIDFAEKASDPDTVLSHEQFRRICRVYDDYERFLETHGRTNGEVDIAYEMIQDGFRYRIQNHCFAEDIKGYKKK